MECIDLVFDYNNRFFRGEKKNAGFFENKYVQRSFREIYQYQMFTENHTGTETSRGFGLGRAIIGGALFGPVGAVVGGLTKKNIDTYSYTTCTVAITFHNSEGISVETTIEKGMEFMKFLDYAYQMVNQPQGQKQIEITEQEEYIPQSVYEMEKMLELEESREYVKEIKDLKKLYDEGVITQEEFSQKKGVLLGISGTERVKRIPIQED